MKQLYAFICECLRKYWSPEVIANRCKQKGLNVCASTIYRALAESRLTGYSRKAHLRRRGKNALVAERNALQFIRFTQSMKDQK